MRLTCTEAGSSKFWVGSVEGARLTISWGKIGAKGQTKILFFSDGPLAEAELARLVKEKLKKGYVAETEEPGIPSETEEGPDSAMGLTNLVARLDRWFSSNRPDYYNQLRPGATTRTLASVEKSLGRPLPPALRALLEWHDGEEEGCVGRFFENWSLMDSKAIVGTVKGMNRLEKAGEFDFDGWWRTSWTPFLENGGATISVLIRTPGRCLSSGTTGRIERR